MDYLYSATDLYNLKLDCLPATRESIARKARLDQWEYKEVRGKGGKGGLKRVYKLPDYVQAEIKAKAKPAPSCETRHTQSKKSGCNLEVNYSQWFSEQSWDEIVLIPFYTDIHSNQKPQAIPFQQHLIENIFKRNPKDLVCVCAKGDSMYPTIKENDNVLFDLTIKEYDTEGIYLVCQNNELSIKRLQKIIGNKLHILSDNKTLYELTEVDLEKKSVDFQIIGKYLWSATFIK